MNIEPPAGLDWALLLVVGAIAGAINALKAIQKKGLNLHQMILIWAVEVITAMFVTMNTFLMLDGFLPLFIAVLANYFPGAFAVRIPKLALIGLSGWLTHVGLWNLIVLVRGMRERRKIS